MHQAVRVINAENGGFSENYNFTYSLTGMGAKKLEGTTHTKIAPHLLDVYGVMWCIMNGIHKN